MRASQLRMPDGSPVDASERQRCEIWTRVMGYHRPVSAWNLGKQAEHHERVAFSEHPQGHGAYRRG